MIEVKWLDGRWCVMLGDGRSASSMSEDTALALASMAREYQEMIDNLEKRVEELEKSQ